MKKFEKNRKKIENIAHKENYVNDINILRKEHKFKIYFTTFDKIAFECYKTTTSLDCIVYLDAELKIVKINVGYVTETEETENIINSYKTLDEFYKSDYFSEYVK